jgi:hypothetical protein
MSQFPFDRNDAPEEVVRQLVSGLPEEAPSMVWRSELNEKLRREADKALGQKRRMLLFSPMLGFATVLLITAIWWQPRISTSGSSATNASASLESALAAAYGDQVDATTGSTLSAEEATEFAGRTSPIGDAERLDFDPHSF